MIPIFALGLIGLVLLAALTGIVAMLVHPKTRVVGVVLLAVGAAMVVAVASVSYMHFARERSMVQEAQMEAQWQNRAVESAIEKQKALNDHKHGPTIELPDEPEKAPAEPTPDEAAEPAAETPPSPPKTTSGRVLNGLLAAISRAVEEMKPKEAEEQETASDTGSGSGATTVAEVAPAFPPEPTRPPTPAWVGQGPRSHGNEYSVAIEIGPCPSLAKCEAELPAAVQRAVARYIDETLGHGPHIAADVQLPANFIENHALVRERWTEPFVFEKPIEGDDGSWTQLHALLVISALTQDQIEQECAPVIVAGRLWYTGTGVAALLAVLAVLFGCLRIDQVTTGSHRGLLITAAVAATAAIAAGGYFALRPIAPESFAPQRVATPASASGVAPVSDDVTMTDRPAERSVAGMRAAVILLPVAAVVVGLLVLMLAARRTRAAAAVLLALVAVGVLVAKTRPIAPLHGSAASVGSMEMAALVVLGVPLLLISMFCREGWGWILGFLVCLAAAAFLTPPDPLSMVIVAAPLCGIYGAIGLAWSSHRNRTTAGEPTAT